MTVVLAVAVTAAAMVAMEGVAYAAHRWVMHGRHGRRWHASHHAPARGVVEANDLFPLVFAAICVAGCAVGSAFGLTPLLWVGAGVFLYGMAYLFVHDIYIHRRVPSPVRRSRWLDRLRDAHAAHHATGGEPFGMLLPRRGSTAEPPPAFDRGAGARAERLATRSGRATTTREG